MLHEPSATTGPDPSSDWKSRLGARLCIVYCVLYAGFVALGIIGGGSGMKTVLFWGLNAAVVYGMGLILFALGLALVYNHLCTTRERAMVKAGAS